MCFHAGLFIMLQCCSAEVCELSDQFVIVKFLWIYIDLLVFCSEPDEQRCTSCLFMQAYIKKKVFISVIIHVCLYDPQGHWQDLDLKGYMIHAFYVTLKE